MLYITIYNMADLNLPNGVTRKNISSIIDKPFIKNLLEDIPEAINDETKNYLESIDSNQKEANEYLKVLSDQRVSLPVPSKNESKIGDKKAPSSSKRVPSPSKDRTQSKKESNKETSKLKEFFSKITGNISKALEKNSDNIKSAMLGPLSLVVAPFEDFLGSDLWDGIKGLTGKLFNKNKKKNPTISDLVKNGEMGIIFLWNRVKGFFGGDAGSKDKNKTSPLDMLKIKPTGLAGALAKAGAFAAIIGSLVMAVVDGLKGMKLAEMWGTGKVAGFIGGFLGGTEKGWKGAFKNAGKWALMGVGAGFLIAGPIGAIVGGLIGGAIGAILGFIGGENIAKFFQSIFNWGKKQLDKVGNFLKNSDFVQGMVTWAKNTVSTIFSGFTNTITDFKAVLSGDMTLKTFFTNFVDNIFGTIGTLVKDFLNTNPIGQWISKYIINPIKDFFQSIGDTFAFLGSMSFGDLVKSIASGNFETDMASFKAKKKEERMKEYILGSDQYNAWRVSQGASLSGLSTDKIFELFSASSKGKELQKQYEATHVNDAIIRPDGSIIRTHPDDTIIATKNTPALNGLTVGSGSGGGSLSDTDSSSIFSGNEIQSGNSKVLEAKLNKVISLLSAILSKEPVQVNLPNQSRFDLDALVNGSML